MKKIFILVKKGLDLVEQYKVKKGFDLAEFDLIDLMPNGQLRYAVYGLDGVLLPYSSSDYGLAGKPAKCMWCHEGIISPLFTNNQEVLHHKQKWK